MLFSGDGEWYEIYNAVILSLKFVFLAVFHSRGVGGNLKNCKMRNKKGKGGEHFDPLAFQFCLEITVFKTSQMNSKSNFKYAQPSLP